MFGRRRQASALLITMLRCLRQRLRVAAAGLLRPLRETLHALRQFIFSQTVLSLDAFGDEYVFLGMDTLLSIIIIAFIISYVLLRTTDPDCSYTASYIISTHFRGGRINIVVRIWFDQLGKSLVQLGNSSEGGVFLFQLSRH